MHTFLTGLGRYFAVTAVAAASIAVASPARATTIGDYLSTCTSLNCEAIMLNGISNKNAYGDSLPFTTSVFADVNECLRLDVTAETADMRIVLVSPSGARWNVDDRVPGDVRPLITARSDVKGYYTVQINYYTGNQPLDTTQAFTLAYGRYNIGNTGNCPTPMSPNLVTPASRK